MNAPDIVNTVEHVDAQLACLRDGLVGQRDLLRNSTVRVENDLLAAYEFLYQGAPEARAEVAAIRSHFGEIGEIYGGTAHLEGWITDWLSRLGNRNQ